MLCVLLSPSLTHLVRCLECPVYCELDASSSTVATKVVSTSVGAPNALDPAVRGETLCVPTIARVVSHFVCHVLTETQFLTLDTNGNEILLDARHEVAESLVSNQSLSEGEYEEGK